VVALDAPSRPPGPHLGPGSARVSRDLRSGSARVSGDLPPSGGTEVSGAEILPALLECDVVVRSPGVSTHRPELQALRRHGVAVVTSTGLWLAEPRNVPVIGVTGTKGKSTTAALTAHLLRGAGLVIELAGNIGRSAIELLGAPTPDCYVIELSSYQIADLECGVDVAVFTNLHPEHADWHCSTAQYYTDKLRLAELAPVRAVVLNACDARLEEVAAHLRAAAARSAGVEARSGAAGVRPEPIEYGCRGQFTSTDGVVRRGTSTLLCESALGLRGSHNLLNLCAALTAAETRAELPEDIAATIKTFQPLTHRLQSLGFRDSVEWIDDSISTTPESVIAAVAALADRPLVLIGGGFDRGQDYRELAAILATRDVVIIGLPATGTRLVRQARDAGIATHNLLEANDLDRAVALARERAKRGGSVLLSPGAPSFGQFSSFEHRGMRFAELAGFGGSPAPEAKGLGGPPAPVRVRCGGPSACEAKGSVGRPHDER